ncbi:G-patch domain-containing protein [Loa loa]|uniref:G patch domain-containing protein 11 n=1 Tax=Loa loa TaxID=7209 RepID=A0A1I7V5J9_LOALO|nr:G-patch domain-containing protein [Loa loa]EFO27552.1 G-patch domain-containing protein [Loa loa]
MIDPNGATTDDVDDDYMSDTYTALDVRPGIARTQTQWRHLKAEAKRVENIERLRNLPKRSEMEKKMRDDALAKPVSENSKGFLLLSKMGYRPGMSLGVEKEGCSEGIKVPIALELKTNRTGLGHDAEEHEKQRQRMDLYQRAVLERAKANDVLIDDFSIRKRWAARMKQLSKDLKESRKVCQELDARSGLELPTSSHFWPIYKVSKEDNTPSLKKTRIEESTCITECFTYFNGKVAPDDLNTNELLENEITEWLIALTKYLRAAHCYCIWCGAQYDSKEELENSCPGKTREEHEDYDEDS